MTLVECWATEIYDNLYEEAGEGVDVAWYNSHGLPVREAPDYLVRAVTRAREEWDAAREALDEYFKSQDKK